MAANLPITPPTLADDYCFSTWQQLALDIVGGAWVQLDNSGWTMLLNQSATPTASQRDYLWFRPSDDRVYRWDDPANAWVAKHESAASGLERRIFVGAASQVPTYDGGDSNAAGDASGAMWEIDTAFAARFPLGNGTLPSGTIVSSASTGGAEEVTLTTDQIPSHTHTYTGKGDTGAGGSGGGAWVGDGTARLTEATGGGEAHNNLPPYVGCYFIKRTARIYRKAA